jgi:hypothetical protein
MTQENLTRQLRLEENLYTLRYWSRMRKKQTKAKRLALLPLLLKLRLSLLKILRKKNNK